MAELKDLFYHGQIQQIKRVLDKMTPDQIDKGLNSFVDGDSNWSQCFFAQALEMDKNYDKKGNAEFWVMRTLGLESIVPVRIVYNIFDGAGGNLGWSRQKLGEFCSNIRDDKRPQEVLDLIKSLKIDWNNVEGREMVMSCKP